MTEEGYVRLTAPDGPVLEMFDRGLFAHGDLPDRYSVAIAKDCKVAPILSVHPELWLEIETRFPRDHPDVASQTDFVVANATRIAPGNAAVASAPALGC